MQLTRGRRRPFECGHRGFGKYCHRCQLADDLRSEIEKLQLKAISKKGEGSPDQVEVLAARIQELRALPSSAVSDVTLPAIS